MGKHTLSAPLSHITYHPPPCTHNITFTPEVQVAGYIHTCIHTTDTHIHTYPLEIPSHIAQLLLDLVHKGELLHHVPLPVGHQFLEVIGQQFASDIHTFDAFLNALAINKRQHVGEGEA